VLGRGRTVVLVSLTGVIYGGIVVLWLCYLVPLALRRYDEASRARSVERFSTAMRVLGRADDSAPARGRGAGDRRPVAPSRSLQPTDSRVRAGGSTRARPVDARAARAAARAAARRRRRVLIVLLVLTAATAGVCAFGLAPWWALAAPLSLVVGFLVLARLQVARARGRTWERSLAAAVQAEQASVPVTSTDAGAGVAEPVGDAPDNAPTVGLDAVAPTGEGAGEPVEQVVAAAVVTADGGSLWDPLPVTLPTYVSKSRATRSVRTIDLGGPGAWTSGRLTAEDAQQTRESEGGVSPARSETEHARAVGD